MASTFDENSVGVALTATLRGESIVDGCSRRLKSTSLTFLGDPKSPVIETLREASVSGLL
jgi:hypothetical protein